jgi:hypothetical protein
LKEKITTTIEVLLEATEMKAIMEVKEILIARMITTEEVTMEVIITTIMEIVIEIRIEVTREIVVKSFVIIAENLVIILELAHGRAITTP